MDRLIWNSWKRRAKTRMDYELTNQEMARKRPVLWNTSLKGCQWWKKLPISSWSSSKKENGETFVNVKGNKHRKLRWFENCQCNGNR